MAAYRLFRSCRTQALSSFPPPNDDVRPRANPPSESELGRQLRYSGERVGATRLRATGDAVTGQRSAGGGWRIGNAGMQTQYRRATRGRPHLVRGGCVLFGIAPDGRVVGQQVNEGTIEKLSAELQRITPQAFPSIERVPAAGGREIIAVAVDAGPARPYSYRGVAYRRVGNTTLTLSADAYQRMLLERMHSEQRWENQPAGGWSVDELDAAEIRRTVTAALSHGRLGDPGASQAPADLLRGLGLFRDGALCRAAVALFGRAERLEFEMPQCLLRVARFRGTDRTEFLDNRQFHGHAFALLATQNVSSARPCLLPGDLRRIASSGSTNRCTRLWPRARRWRTRCATAIMPSAAGPWAWPYMTTVWRSRLPERCLLA